MEDEYTEFILGLVENRIRDLRLRLDRSKYPICEDEKLTTAEVASIEAEIKHWKLELKLIKKNYDL